MGKPPLARCTIEWKKGQVTAVTSGYNMSESGMSRHILDIRLVITPGYQCPSGGSEENNACEWEDDEGSVVMEGGGGGEVLGSVHRRWGTSTKN